MKIIYVKNNSILNQEIEKAFMDLNCNLIYHYAPLSEDINDSSYLQSFLEMVKKHAPVFVFSPTFYPILSLACGVLKIPYIVWLTEGYNKNYYSTFIRNEWNCIFAADSAVYKDLRNLGVENIFFLPLGAPEFEESLLNITDKGEYRADVSLIGNILAREDFIYNPISMSSPLKDATKGYLEGCIACQHQFHGMESICSNLPGYIWEDLSKAYPPELENTLLNAQKYYEYNFFNPMITYADREMRINCYTMEDRYQKINVYSKKSSCEFEGISFREPLDYYKELPLAAMQSVINLVITHRNQRAMISPTAWAIMAAGGFMLSNYQEDYSILETCPSIFNTETEMLSLSAYYYHHEDERKDMASKIKQEVIEKHTYRHRVQELLAIIC